MRRDKTIARVLLIFSIASIVLAVPTPGLLRQRRLVIDRAGDDPTDESGQAQGSLVEPEQKNDVLPAAPPAVESPDESEETPVESEETPVASKKTPVEPDYLVDYLDRLWDEHLPAAISPPVPVSEAPESHSDVPPVSEGPESESHDARISPDPWWTRPPDRPKVGSSSSSEGFKPFVDERLTNWMSWHDWFRRSLE